MRIDGFNATLRFFSTEGRKRKALPSKLLSMKLL